LISLAAFDKLQQYGTIPDLQVCPVCVEEEFVRKIAASRLIDAVGIFDELNKGGGCAMSTDWVTQWKNGKLPEGKLPTANEYTIFCEHNKPWKEKRWVPVSLEAVTLIRSIVGEFPVFQADEPDCEECTAAAEGDQEARAEWEATTKTQKRIKGQCNLKPVAFGLEYCVVPKRFSQAWTKWLSEFGPRPELEMDLCEHGLIDFDPMMETVDYLTELGWRLLCEK